MEDDININLFSNIELKNQQVPREIFKIYDTFFINSVDFLLLKNFIVISCGTIPSFVETDDILSPIELYKFFNQIDVHGLFCVQVLAALNSHLGSDKNISKNAMTEFFQNLSLQALNELDETTNIKFDPINEFNKSINNLLMDETNKLINKKNQRFSFNLVNDFKLENKKIEEDVVDNILNDFTIAHPQESDHLFYPNTADETNTQSHYEEEQKRKLDMELGMK